MKILMENLDMCSVAFAVINPKGSIIYTNSAFEKIFDFKKEELHGYLIDDFCFTDVKTQQKISLSSLVEQSESLEPDYRKMYSCIDKNGWPLYVDVNMDIIEKENQEFGLVHVLDITKRYKSRLLLERTQDVAKIGSWEVVLATNKCLWSRVTYNIHELDVGTDIHVEDGINFYAEEHRPLIRGAVEKCVADLEPWDLELQILTTSGKRKWVHALGGPVLENGKLVGLEGTFQDIDERKTLETQHTALLARLSLALKASQIGIWDWDIASNHLIWDAEMYKLTGVREEDFDGALSTWQQCIHPQDAKQSQIEIEAALAGEKDFNTSFRYILPSGEIRDIRAIGQVFRDDQGRPVKMIGVNWDITEMNARKRNLERANDELAQFAYRTSHDLKAPLVSVRGLAKAGIEEVESQNYEEVRDIFGRVVSQCARLEKLVIDILDLAKADFRSTEAKQVCLVEMIEDVLSKKKVEAQTRGVDLEFVRESDSLPIKVEEVRLVQILENLVSNAIKYKSPKKDRPHVKVRLHEKGTNLLLSVEDNGLGFPEEFQAKAFGMFQRFHPEVAPGTGLGLYIVKKHIDQMNGKISLSSSEEGSHFQIELPKEQLM